MLLTTPESLALLLSYEDARRLLRGPALRRPRRAARAGREQARRPVQPRPRPAARGWRRRRASSASRRPWRHPARLQRYLSPRPGRGRDRRRASPAPSREVALLLPEGEMPWAGHMAIYAAKDVYRLIQERRVTLVFVNTRAQAELMFGALWRLNEANLPIAPAPRQPRRRAAAQGRGGDGARDACAPWSAPPRSTSASTGATSTSSSRSARPRVPPGCCSGSAAPTTGSTSRAAPPWCPANRFEVLECIAAQDALHEHTLDGGAALPRRLRRAGAARHRRRLRRAVRRRRALRRGPRRGALRRPRRAPTSTPCSASSPPAATRSRPTTATGAWSGARTGSGGCATRSCARQYRMNVGTIVEAPVMRVRLGPRQGAGRGRGVFRLDARPRATPSCSPGGCSRSRASAATR